MACNSDQGWLHEQRCKIISKEQFKLFENSTILDDPQNYTIDPGNWILGSLEHTYMNLLKDNTSPMLSSLLCILIGFTALNFAISDDIPEIKESLGTIDKLVSSFYVTVQILTFRNLKEPPTSSLAKLLVVMQQLVFFLILLFFFQHFAGSSVMRQWMA